MSAKVAICVDKEILFKPEKIGLKSESILMQPWLKVFYKGNDLRKSVKNYSFEKIWVHSSNDVEPINLAAYIKAMSPTSHVTLIDRQPTGSLISRAKTAGIDQVVNGLRFVEIYKKEKEKFYNQVDLKLPVGSMDINEEEDAESIKKYYENLLDDYSNVEKRTEVNKLINVSDIEEKDIDTSHASVFEPELNIISKKGASVRPVMPNEIRDIRKTIETSNKKSKKSGYLVPIVSGSGGTGKSSIAATMAYLANDMGVNTLLLDLDLQFGDIRFFTGIDTPVTVDEVLKSNTAWNDVMATAERPAVITAPFFLENGDIQEKQLLDLIGIAKAKFDLVIVNTGAYWTEQHAVLLENCYKAMFVVDQRVSSLRSCKHAIELCKRCSIALSPFVFLVNRVSKDCLFTAVDVSYAFSEAPAYEIKDSGMKIEELLARGFIRKLISENSEFVISCEEALKNIVTLNFAQRSLKKEGLIEGFSKKLFNGQKRNIA